MTHEAPYGDICVAGGEGGRIALVNQARAGALLDADRRRKQVPRTLIEPHKGDKRYVRRKSGKFTSKQVNVGRSLAADRRSKSKHVVKKGEGDRGDQKRA